MRTITRDEIVQVWEALCDLDKPASQRLAQEFMGAQPALGVFLFTCLEELGAGAEDSRVIELALGCWQAMNRAAGGRLNTVTPERVEAAEQANTRYLEQLDEGSEMDWNAAVPRTFSDYNQRETLGFALEVLMSGHEDTPELAPEQIGMEWLWVKTVIDCLDQ